LTLFFGTQKLAPNYCTTNCFKAQSFCLTFKNCTQISASPKCFKARELLFATQKLAPNCTTKCFKDQRFSLALKSLHPIAQQNASQLKALVWHTKACTQFQHPKKCFKAQSFCLALKKLTPNCTTKCSKAQSFCLALKKSLRPIAQQNAPKLKYFVWHSREAYTQLHNKMLQNSKLLIDTQRLTPNNWKCFKAPNPSFKLLQNETRSREKRKRKKTPSKHHHQNTKHSPYHHEEELREEEEEQKEQKMQQKITTTSKNSKEKNVKVNLLHTTFLSKNC
jgi:hypothetical protein